MSRAGSGTCVFPVVGGMLSVQSRIVREFGQALDWPNEKSFVSRVWI